MTNCWPGGGLCHYEKWLTTPAVTLGNDTADQVGRLPGDGLLRSSPRRGSAHDRETPGNYGGRIVVAQRSQPKTLNPVLAIDGPSREVIQLLMADLVHINRASQEAEPALARSVEASPDGRRYTLRLRRGLRFSDGHGFDADDVLFTFQVYLDEKVGSPQRDLLIVGGKPLSVWKEDAYTLVFEFAEPYGPGTRLFDNIAILPRHLLWTAYRQGHLGAAWNLNSPPSAIAGLGPFRFKRPGSGGTAGAGAKSLLLETGRSS